MLLFFQTWAFHVSYHLLIHSLCSRRLALLAAVLCPVAADYGFHAKLRLSVTCLESFILLLRWEYGPVRGEVRERGRLIEEIKGGGFCSVWISFENVIKRHNELFFIDCSATFWTNIFITSGKGKHMCAQQEVKNCWLLTCWVNISFIML